MNIFHTNIVFPLTENEKSRDDHIITGLRIIEDRQLVTRSEYSNTLQKLDFNYQMLLTEKENTCNDISETKKNLKENSEKKVDITEKHKLIFNRCENKLKEMKNEEQLLKEKHEGRDQ